MEGGLSDRALRVLCAALHEVGTFVRLRHLIRRFSLGRSLASVEKKSPAEYARGSLGGAVFGLGCGAPRLTSLINASCFASFLLPLRQRVQGTPTRFPEALWRDLARRPVRRCVTHRVKDT